MILSSSGKEMHTRYFSSSNVITEISKTTFVYSQSNERIGTLDKGSSVLVVSSPAYSSKFEVRYGDDQIGFVSNHKIRKPFLGGASERLQIKASDLIAGGDRRQYQGTEVAWFDNKDKLIQSMLDGVADKVSPSVLTVLEKVFQAPLEPFEWPSIASHEINELGKYGGEFLPHILWDNVKASAFPLNPHYPIVDSFLIHPEGPPSGLSSKFGSGAKASLFTLIYTDAIPEDCVFKTLSTHYLNSEKPMAAVYSTGFQEILPTAFVDYPNHIYESLKNGESPIWLEAFRPVDDLAVAKAWPQSLTAYFTRKIAKRLNECETSQRWLNNLINQKNILQVHLDPLSWKHGRIKLDVKSFKDCRILVSGSKSAIKDVRAKQGLLNYSLQ